MALVINTLINLWRLVRNGVTQVLGRPPEYVVFTVGGSLPELRPRTGFLRRRLRPGPPVLSLEEVRGRLDRVSGDGRVRGVVLRVQSLDADWATLEELRLELTAYRERGGRVVVYLVEADTRAYYLACVADEVLATPLATVGVTGVRTRISFLRDALEAAGVEAEVFAVSPYKSAYDAFVRQDFSEEAREQAERLVERRFSELVSAIAEGRGLTSDEVRERIDRAPYAARDAVEAGLLDGVCYEDELAEKLRVEDRKARLTEWEAARRTLKLPYRGSPRQRVGLVSLSGVIVRGQSRNLPVPLPFVGGEQAGSESVVAALRAAEKNRRVGAVVFHVDSRGGDSLASDLIWREVCRINAKKPVVVLMGNAAASGGYYVSASAGHIVARSNTVTGSIGVISLRPIAAGLYGRLRVNPAAVERGARSGIFDPSLRPSEDERRVLGGQVQAIYAEFKDRVVRGRGLDPDRLEALAGGRVWTGAEAHGHGLVDELGGYRTALKRARELAGIKADGPEVVVRIPPPRGVRPTPGDPAEAAREVLDGLKEAARDFRSPRAWLLGPYTFSGD